MLIQQVPVTGVTASWLEGLGDDEMFTKSANCSTFCPKDNQTNYNFNNIFYNKKLLRIN